jgi:Uma2 family endonuclease
MIHPNQKFVTPDKYLALEEKADYKSEYRNGEIVALAGASSNHNLIVGNVYMALRQALAADPCRVYSNDMRLYIEKGKLYTYPDVMVVCGKIDFVPGRRDTLTNPIAVVEVWSESTRDYDRGEKFGMYRKISALQEYVMIDQDRPYVEHYRRDGHFWVLETLDSLRAKLNLRMMKAEIPVKNLYLQVEWEDKPKHGKRTK